MSEPGMKVERTISWTEKERIKKEKEKATEKEMEAVEKKLGAGGK